MKSVRPFITITSYLALSACLSLGFTPSLRAQDEIGRVSPTGTQNGNQTGIQAPTRMIAMTDAQRRAYIPKVGDLIGIEVLHHDELSGNFPVRGDGYVRMPVVKPIAVAGRPIWQIENNLRRELGLVIASPMPKIQLLRRADILVTIGGEVRGTGRKTLLAESRLQDVIADAGGITADKPEWAEAVITRKGRVMAPIVLSNILERVLIDANIELFDGDSVLIRRRPQTQTHVLVSGPGVRNPGWFPIPADRSLISALSAAGGLLPEASLVRGEILRGETKVPVDLTAEGSKLRSIQLTPGDTLYIPVNPFKFAVLGAVNQSGPKAYPENETLTIMRAIALSGGLQTETADLKNATLYRASSNGKDIEQTIKVDLTPLVKKNNLSKDLEIRPGDILNIPTKKAKRSFDIVDALQLLPVLFLFRQTNK
jgi:protein involved in polysaccharide export with SLBB domain